MKILWIAPIPFINNKDAHPAPWIMTLAEELTKHNIELTILNYNFNLDEDIVNSSYKNINLIYIKTPKPKIDTLTFYRLRINRVRAYLKQTIADYDLVHIHGTEHQYEAMVYGLHQKIVISIQGIISECIKVLPKSLIQQYLGWQLSSFYELMYVKKFSSYSCRTHWDSNFIKSNNPNAKVFMIWEMIRRDFFNDFYNESSNKILFVGGKNPIKGLRELLCAYNDSLQEKGFKIIILGNCKEKNILDIIEKYNFDKIDVKNIEIRGMQDSVGMIQAYKDSFCLVHPTYIDNSPNSICEAQISGLPVIATDVGGVSSLINHEKTGLLIDRKPESISLAVQTLHNNKNLWHEISNQSKIIARERHNPIEIIKQTIEMYKAVME